MGHGLVFPRLRWYFYVLFDKIEINERGGLGSFLKNSGKEGEQVFFRKKKEKKTYDKEKLVPVLRCSICTGEQVAGFKDVETGKFHEVSLIRSEGELKAFMEEYGIASIKKEY